MLKRLYVDNYKCLVNFEYQPGKVQLILGGNGSGKSTVFEILAKLHALLWDGASTSQLFPPETLTRWQTHHEQRFEIDVELAGGIFRYAVTIEHDNELKTSIVSQENLSLNDQILFSVEKGVASVFPSRIKEGNIAFLDWNRSGLIMITNFSSVDESTPDIVLIVYFLKWVKMLFSLQIDPYRMSAISSKEQSLPSGHLSNYASWYRHISQEEPNVVFRLRDYLRDVFDGFENFSLSKEGEMTRILKAEFKDTGKKAIKYNFDELSEGQRAIVGLYTLLAVMGQHQITLCIDEPDNFIMLTEIQPWLLELQDQAETHNSQVLVISHHPELINSLGPMGAVRFSRDNGGPSRVKPFTTEGNGSLPPAEIIARGWDHG